MMKNLIRKILKESHNEKIISLLSKKFQLNEFIDAIEFLEKLGYNKEESMDVIKHWFSDKGIELNMEYILSVLIDVDFGDLYFGWGFYNCGMGTCCDPEYISISKGHEEEVFKLVNNDYIDRYHFNNKKRKYEELPEICMDSPEDHKDEYETLVISDEDLFENLDIIFGKYGWQEPLISFINKKFNTNITNFEPIY